jgi:hypothetical protein
MKRKLNGRRIIYIIGIIAFLIGVLDPLEGSVIIAAGSFLITLSTYLNRDKHWKLFMASCIMIIVGVFFMFYFSTLGGFGGTSRLSWWWGLLIIPYPLGWLLSLILLIMRSRKKREDYS